MKSTPIVVLFWMIALSPSAARADDYVESGRFGLLGAITEDGFQFGGVRETDNYETVITVDGSSASPDTSSSLLGTTGDMGLTFHAGPRFNIHNFNYLSVGIEYHASVLGNDNGVSTAGSQSGGPYVGLQRHFSGTNLMLSLWMLPYSYNHVVSNDGAGNSVTTNTHHFFQSGGFGIAYLF